MSDVPNNGLPAYQRIQGTIVKQLELGLLKPGDPVDSERELARIHGVSLMTARHALTTLEREGLVVRRRGAGTFVAPPKIHFNKLMSYTEQMSSFAGSHRDGTGNCRPSLAAGHKPPDQGRTPPAWRR